MAKPPKKGKRFRYNLAAVLKFREIREQQEQEKFVEKQKEFQEEKKKEEEIKAFQAEKYVELREELSGGQTIDFHQVQVRKGHLEILKDEVIEQEKKRVDSEEAMEEQRDVLVQSVKERKVLDKDKEKKKDLWKKMMGKEESKFMDEIGGIGQERQRREQQNQEFDTSFE